MSQAVRLKSRLKLFSLKQNVKLSACNRKADKNYCKRSKNEHHITLIYCSTHQNCYSFTKKSPDRVTNDLNTKQTNGDSCSGIKNGTYWIDEISKPSCDQSPGFWINRMHNEARKKTRGSFIRSFC